MNDLVSEHQQYQEAVIDAEGDEDIEQIIPTIKSISSLIIKSISSMSNYNHIIRLY